MLVHVDGDDEEAKPNVALAHVINLIGDHADLGIVIVGLSKSLNCFIPGERGRFRDDKGLFGAGADSGPLCGKRRRDAAGPGKQTDGADEYCGEQCLPGFCHHFAVHNAGQ
ncbi:MAG: hypothetical protein JWN25_1604 [Verrucomicrobiales bacterium]|nr:hypothetical protein [Verrucomicrobiales bacterium]